MRCLYIVFLIASKRGQGVSKIHRTWKVLLFCAHDTNISCPLACTWDDALACLRNLDMSQKRMYITYAGKIKAKTRTPSHIPQRVVFPNKPLFMTHSPCAGGVRRVRTVAQRSAQRPTPPRLVASRCCRLWALGSDRCHPAQMLRKPARQVGLRPQTPPDSGPGSRLGGSLNT